MVKEPVYEYRKVQSGTRTVTTWVPRYAQKQILVGYKTVEHSVPIYEERRVQVGTRTVTLPTPATQTGSDLAGGGGEERGLLREELLFQEMMDSADPIPKDVDPASSPEGEEELTDSWLYKTILFFQNLKASLGKIAEKLGAPNAGSDQPHLFSYSVYEEAPLNLLSEDGILVNAYQPSWFLDLFYTQQELAIGPKVVITSYPDGLMNLNLSSKSWSMKIGKTTIFASLNGEFGFGSDIENNLPYFDSQQVKHSFIINIDGFSYKVKIEGVVLDPEKSNDHVLVKEIKTLKCSIITFKTLGILIAVLASVLFAALLYLYFSAGGPLPSTV